MLLQNITLNNQYPYRRSGATATNTETGYMSSQHGSGGPRQFQRFMHFGEGAGFPSGYNPGFFMPLLHSWVSSLQEAVVSMQPAGSGLMGLPGEASSSMSLDTLASILPLDDSSPLRTALGEFSLSATSDILPLDDSPMNNIGVASFSVSVADAFGELITSGIGEASLSVYFNEPLLLASLDGGGSASINVTLGTSLLSGEASISADGTFSFSLTADALPEDDSIRDNVGLATFNIGALADALPEDDTPPARTAVGVITVTGSMEPFATGLLVGEAFLAGGAIDEFAILGRMEYDNAVHIDVTNGQPGTKDPIGTKGSPVNNITDALAIARNLNLSQLELLSDLTLVSGDDVSGYKISSSTWKAITIESGAITDDTEFEKVSVYGELSGTWNVLVDCWVYDITNFLGWVRGGSIERVELAPYTIPSPISLGSSYFDNLVPMYADVTSTLVMNADVSVSLTGCTDIVTVTNMTAGSVVNASLLGGKLIIDETCVGGEVIISGVGGYDNNSLLVIDHTGLTNDDSPWGAIAVDNNEAGTMGNKLNTASSGGVDMNALAEAVRTELESTTIPVNTKKINDVEISGSGSAADPWGPV